jgi:integrase/recombinase XerC
MIQSLDTQQVARLGQLARHFDIFMIYMENQFDITSSKRYVRKQTTVIGDLQMSSNTVGKPTVCFTFSRQEGRITDISTNAPLVNHFLDLIKMSRTYNTWISYAHDLKVFFEVIPKPPEAITRVDCVAFMKRQDQAGCSDATINRRLAAVSSLFNELRLLDPARFPQNPVRPCQRLRGSPQRSQSLYRKQPQRVPDVLSDDDLRTFFGALPSWRDRALVLLMWISCLRVSEAVAIRFQDIECSRRSIHICAGKGNSPRTVFMNSLTFAALNRYLDEERKSLFPDVDHVFVGFKGKARGKPLSANAVQKMVYYYAEKCHLAHLHAHLFRHTGITQLVQEGMAEPAVREFVGHRSPDSLAPYLHLCDEFVDAEFEQAQAALNPSQWLDFSLPGGES